MNQKDWETTDVVICGCGPTGALLSAYLGRAGVHNVVLEKEPTITTDPRGIALDDDGIRYLQGLGLYDFIYTKIGTCESPYRHHTRETNKPSNQPWEDSISSVGPIAICTKLRFWQWTTT